MIMTSALEQCDQIARLFVQNLAIYSNENWPNSNSICQRRLNFLEVLNKPSKHC